MKLLIPALLLTSVWGSNHDDESSLIQAKIASKKGSEVEDEDGKVLIDLLEKTALLIRSGHSIDDQLAALPEEAREQLMDAAKALTDSVSDTTDTSQFFARQLAMLQEGQDPFDGTHKKKSHPRTKTFHETLEDGTRQKVTETRNGDHYLHRITNSKFGTETTTKDKFGRKHNHKYSHNGRGGNAKTNTSSSKGNWLHGHKHSHDHDIRSGKTETRTETVSKGDGILDVTHTHGHTHRHQAGVGTLSSTHTVTDSKLGTHDHSHLHSHNEITAKVHSDTDHGNKGPKLGDIFKHRRRDTKQRK